MAVEYTNNQEQSDYKMAFYPIIDPRAQLPENFPNIEEYIKKLGKSPKYIQHRFEDFTVVFKNGLVYYIFDEEDFHYYPQTLTLLKPNTINKVETEITFDILRDLEIPDNGVDWNTHFLLNDKAILRVNLPEKDLLDTGDKNGKRNI